MCLQLLTKWYYHGFLVTSFLPFFKRLDKTRFQKEHWLRAPYTYLSSLAVVPNVAISGSSSLD